MTYKYCLLAAGHRLSSKIPWETIHAVVPTDTTGNEIICHSEAEEIRLWNLRVLSYSIENGVMTVMLKPKVVM